MKALDILLEASPDELERRRKTMEKNREARERVRREKERSDTEERKRTTRDRREKDIAKKQYAKENPIKDRMRKILGMDWDPEKYPRESWKKFKDNREKFKNERAAANSKTWNQKYGNQSAPGLRRFVNLLQWLGVVTVINAIRDYFDDIDTLDILLKNEAITLRQHQYLVKHAKLDAIDNLIPWAASFVTKSIIQGIRVGTLAAGRAVGIGGLASGPPGWIMLLLTTVALYGVDVLVRDNVLENKTYQIVRDQLMRFIIGETDEEIKAVFTELKTLRDDGIEQNLNRMDQLEREMGLN
jgi:hypothetical protein